MNSLYNTEPLTFTNIAIRPDGTIMPWRGVKTTQNPPVLRFDGQILWLPKRQALLQSTKGEQL